MVTVEYYNKDVGNNPQNAASYNEKRHANITTKPIDTSILSSKNADKLEAGDPVNFTVQLQLPECETNLSVVVDLPTVPESVIDLARKRRSSQGIGIESEEDNLRLVVSFYCCLFGCCFSIFLFLKLYSLAPQLTWKLGYLLNPITHKVGFKRFNFFTVFPLIKK